jgi:hypothetical protein
MCGLAVFKSEVQVITFKAAMNLFSLDLILDLDLNPARRWQRWLVC